jgi:uncharacterized membrane protein
VNNKTYAVLVAGSTLWCLSIVAAPLFGLKWVYALFAGICHQDAARSWHIANEPLAACIRCSSIYFAFTASLWLGLKTNVNRLRFSILFLLIEFAFARFVIDHALLRSVSGVLVGISAAPFVKQGVEELRDAM